MTGTLPVILPAVIVLASLVALYRMPRIAASWVGATSALTMAVLVPSFSTSAPVAVVAVLGTIAILALALLRDRDELQSRTFPLLLLLFLAWSAGMGSVGSPVKLVLLNLATGVLLILFVIVVVVAVTRGHNLFLPFAAMVISLEVLIGVAEEFLGWKALWPRANGTDVISHRVNEILPLLTGRAMGSTGQPIPYGMLLGYCVIICLWFAFKGRSKLLWTVSGLGLTGMIFSGTRSALIALAIALALWALMRARRKPKLLLVMTGSIVSATLLISVTLLNAMGSAFFSSASFAHRAGILFTAGGLFARNPLEVIFGTGYSSVATLLKTGVVHGVPGINVFDEEYVRTFACLGLVGITLLGVTIVQGFMKADELPRLLIVFVTASFFAFDGFSWRLFACLLVLAIAHGHARQESQEPTRINNRRPIERSAWTSLSERKPL